MKDKVIGVRLQEEDVLRIKAKIGEGSISKYIRWLIEADLSFSAPVNMFEPTIDAPFVGDPVLKPGRSLHRPRNLDEHTPVNIPMVRGTAVTKNDPLSLRNGQG